MKSKGSSQPTHLITPGAWQRSWKSCSGLVAACVDFPPSFVELAFVFAWSLSVAAPGCSPDVAGTSGRSEEHTSELQSRLHLVCRLLLEKKKKNITKSISILYTYET